MKSFWKNKKVLLTGAAGFIGSNVCDLLVERGAKVTAVVSNNSNISKIKKNLSLSQKYIKIKKVDLLDFETVLKVTKGADIILNFAAKDGSATYKEKNSSQIYRENTNIVLNILEAARINNVARLLLVSSIVIYSSYEKIPFKESNTHYYLDEPANGYEWSKRFTEVAAKIYVKQYGLKIAVARLGNVYGPRDYAKEKGRVIPVFIDKALRNDDITIWGDGLSKKSFIYVSDLAHALLNLVELFPTSEPINVASKNVLSIKDLAKLIIKLTKSKSKLIFLKSEVGVMDRVVDIKKAERVINFKEKVSLEEGLIKTINYFNSLK